MKLDDLKTISYNLEEEYKINSYKIIENNENINKIYPNTLIEKTNNVFLGFLATTSFVHLIIISLFLLLNKTMPGVMPIIISLLLSIVTIRLNTKTSKDSSLKEQKELHSYYEYGLKNEYLKNKNRVLYRILSDINKDIDNIESLSEKYNFSEIKEKNEDNSSQTIIKLNENLKKEYNNIKLNSTKCFLKNNLFKTKARKRAETIFTFLLGFLFMILICNMSGFNFIGKSNILLKILIPGLTGGLSFSLTAKTIQKNKDKIFNTINNKLEKEKLNVENIKKDTSFLDLESSISNTCELRNRLEKTKIRYSELLKKQNDKKEENKHDYPNVLERLLDGIPNEPENMLTIDEINSEFFSNNDAQSKPKGLKLVNNEYNKNI